MEVIEFINRRWKKDANWLDGNCYYFALILKHRFPEGRIWYEADINYEFGFRGTERIIFSNECSSIIFKHSFHMR
jgi:hypothetical protein